MAKEADRLSGPTIRLLRLWLWLAPLGMLSLAILFAVLAAGEDNWGLLGAMVALAMIAIALFMAQRRFLHRFLSG